MLEGWQVSSALAVLSGQPLPGTDTSTDLSGTGQKLDRWSIAGDPSNIKTGFGVPCYGVTGSKFAKAGTGCNVVNAGTGSAGTASFVATLPQACIDTAGNEATNPAVVAAGVATSTDSPRSPISAATTRTERRSFLPLKAHSAIWREMYLAMACPIANGMRR